jgi:two-component system, NarL family, sensor histidine kinase EvgS
MGKHVPKFIHALLAAGLLLTWLLSATATAWAQVPSTAAQAASAVYVPSTAAQAASAVRALGHAVSRPPIPAPPKPVVVGLMDNFAPFQVWPDGGDPSGVDLAVLNHLNRSVGLRYGVRRYTQFAAMQKALEAGEIDLIMATASTLERTQTLAFSRPYARVLQALVARSSETSGTFAPDLSGRVLALVRSEANESTARERFPSAKRLLVDSLSDGLKALSTGRADYFVAALPAVRQLVEREALSGLHVLDTYAADTSELRVATTKNRLDILARIEQGLDSLPAQQVQNWERELSPPARFLTMRGSFRLSTSEREQLRSAGPWQVAFVAGDPPYSFVNNDGQPVGLGLDLLNALQDRLGFALGEIKPMSLEAALAAAGSGQVDLLLGVSESASRRLMLSFVGPYRREPMAIVSARGSGLSTLSQISSVALPSAHLARSLLPLRYPSTEVIDCTDVADCERRVLRGEAAATLVQLSRHGRQNAAAGLEVSGMVDSVRFEEHVALGFNKQSLAPQVRRALDDIMVNELPALEDKWLRTAAPGAGGISLETVRRYAAGGLAVLAVGVLGWALHTRRLRAVIAERSQARRTAEAATLERTRYLSFMAHEVRNTLGGMGQATAMLQSDPSPEFAARVLPLLQRSANSTLQLLNDLLDQGRLEAGEMRLVPVPTDVGALTREVVEALQPAALSKGLALSLQDHCPAGQMLSLDPLRLRQIVRNLVANAVKFTPSGSVVVELAAQPSNDALSLSVSDTGPGLDRSTQERLFKPYAQGDSSLPGGSGLGLALSKQLAELMGGRIDVHSSLGQGSRFVLHLPMTIKPQA